jgi:hypothetical protein
VHCHVGVGRSPAVCAALDYVDGLPVFPWFNRYQALNKHIYRTIVNKHLSNNGFGDNYIKEGEEQSGS